VRKEKVTLKARCEARLSFLRAVSGGSVRNTNTPWEELVSRMTKAKGKAKSRVGKGTSSVTASGKQVDMDALRQKIAT
jgi:hypothetical protein